MCSPSNHCKSDGITSGRNHSLLFRPGPKDIAALGVILFAYLKLKLSLRIAGHDADFHSYDWRRSLVDLGKELAAGIRKEGRSVSLVAHSMGGLVARASLAHDVSGLARTIMLGTPNFGSFSPIQAFRGTHSIVRRVAFLDPFHSQEDLAKVFKTFPGLCQMLPSPDKYPVNYFKLTSWPEDGVRPEQTMLTSALKVQRELSGDFPDLVIIAGVDQETVVDASVKNGEFVYTISTDGDGTVPLQCALLANARQTYYVAEEHGSLPNNDQVASAVDSILATGKTSNLPSTHERRRATRTQAVSERTTDVSPYEGNRGRILSAREKRLLLKEVAAPDLTPASSMPLGTIPTASDGPSIAPTSMEFGSSVVIGRRRQHRLEVSLAYGSITEAEAPAYVLGLFKRVPPDGAARAINSALDGAIDQMVARHMFNANVGEISILPTGRHLIRADVVAFVGLGPFDTFNEEVLEAVGENLVRTFVASRISEFATVSMGGNSGTFSINALRRLFVGILRSLQDADSEYRFRGITICETNRDRFKALQADFYQLCGSTLFDGVEVTLREIELPQAVPEAGVRAITAAKTQSVYLIVRQEPVPDHENGVIEYSAAALTSGAKAAIIKGRKRFKSADLDKALAPLGSEAGLDIDHLPSFASKLTELVLPESILTILTRFRQNPLVVVHDAATSRIPWEALRIGGIDDGWHPALEAGLTHRYEAEDLSVAKWLELHQRGPTLSVLLVTDPTKDLNGAREEGKRLRELFESLKLVKLRELFQEQARKQEVLRSLASGEHDVIHYAGHAFFDPAFPARSGILCAGREVLSGADLASVGSLPSLVFFNACEAGRVRRGSQAVEIDPNRSTSFRAQRSASFAEAFLRGGIANFVGTYWPVGDSAALAFGESFYGALLDGGTLGEALMKGRQKVLDARSVDWADYILYGDPDFTLKQQS